MYLCLHIETAVFLRYCYIFSLFLLFCGGVSLQKRVCNATGGYQDSRSNSGWTQSVLDSVAVAGVVVIVMAFSLAQGNKSRWEARRKR